MKQLADQQLRFAPVSVRMEQVGRAEELAFTVNTRQNYSYPDLCEKLTKYRAEMYPNLEVTGEDLLHDLRRFIEDLSDSANLIADAAPEPVLTLQDLSKRFNVSEKTVKRWRDRGLAGSAISVRQAKTCRLPDIARRAIRAAQLRADQPQFQIHPGNQPGTGIHCPSSTQTCPVRSIPDRSHSPPRQANRSSRRNDSLHFESVRRKVFRRKSVPQRFAAAE